jgi:hypothetical protein
MDLEESEARNDCAGEDQHRKFLHVRTGTLVCSSKQRAALCETAGNAHTFAV